jgi:hypothetical protein
MLFAPISPCNILYYNFVYSNVWKMSLFQQLCLLCLTFLWPMYLLLLDSIDDGDYIRWAIPVAHGLWPGSEAACLVGLRVRFPSLA